MNLLHFLGVPGLILLSNFIGVGDVEAAPPLDVLDELFNAPSPSSSGSTSILTDALQTELLSLPGPRNNTTATSLFLRNLPFARDFASTSQWARRNYNLSRSGPVQTPVSPIVSPIVIVPPIVSPVAPVNIHSSVGFSKKWFIDSKRRPVEVNNKVTILEGVEEIVPAMYEAIQTATGSEHFVYMCNWKVDGNLKMPDENGKTLSKLLTEASDKEVQVRSLLFGPGHVIGGKPGNLDLALNSILRMAGPGPELYFFLGGKKLGNLSVANVHGNHLENQKFANEINKLRNGVAYLDEKRLTWGTHHQKILIVRGEKGLIAFCGSFDPTYGRDKWNEVSVEVQGSAAYRLLEVFLERWQDAEGGIKADGLKSLTTGIGRSKKQLKLTGGIPCQVTVTTGDMKDNEPANAKLKPYQFAPSGEMSFRHALVKAIGKANHEIYLECQYGWGQSLGEGLNTPSIRTALAKAIDRGVKVIVITPKQINIPDYNVGNAVMLGLAGTFGAMRGSGDRRGNDQKGSVLGGFLGALKGYSASTSLQIAARALDFQSAQDRFWQDLCRRKGKLPVDIYHTDSKEHYVHSKLWIFDGEFALIGSANFNNRSLSHDSEVMIGFYDPSRLGKLRNSRFAKHTGSPNTRRYTVPQIVHDDLKRVGDAMTDLTFLTVTDPYGGPHEKSQIVKTVSNPGVRKLNQQIEAAKNNDLK